MMRRRRSRGAPDLDCGGQACRNLEEVACLTHGNGRCHTCACFETSGDRSLAMCERMMMVSSASDGERGMSDSTRERSLLRYLTP